MNGGRWNPRGLEVIYAAASVSLAALEVLAHYSVLPLDFAVTQIHIPDSVAVEVLIVRDLPAAWDALAPVPSTQAIGHKRAKELRTAVLRVPSVIVSREWNYLLNPNHPAFGAIRFHRPVPFRFDPRLK